MPEFIQIEWCTSHTDDYKKGDRLISGGIAILPIFTIDRPVIYGNLESVP